jgi:fructokinase
MNNHPFILVGIGELLWDLLPTGKQLGGAPTNFAYHAQALGGNALIASSIGDDALGREILDRFKSLRLSPEYIAIDKTHPTGTVDVKLDASGVPDFTICRNVAWDFIPITDALMGLARQADAVCFGSLAQRSAVSRRAIQRFLAATRPECLRVFDINLRQTYYSLDVIDHSLRACNVLKLNDHELPILLKLLNLPAAEPDALRHLMSRYNLTLIALTRGDKGSRLCVGNEFYDHRGFSTKVIDTVGAGDAFTAALAMGLLHRLSPDQINAAANRLAAYVCSQSGATPPIPANLY